MSRIGKQLIEIPNGVQVTENDRVVTVKGPKGELQHALPENVTLDMQENTMQVKIADENNVNQKKLWGTTASILKNMVTGVTEGFLKQLEVNGVGFKVAASGSKLNMSLGFSHPVEFEIPKGLQATVEKNVITISGIDKQQVGLIASQIRKLKKPEPYKGKGIKYVDEIIRRKAGKAAAGGE